MTETKAAPFGPGGAASTSVLFNEGAGFLPRAVIANRNADPPVTKLDEARTFSGLADPPAGGLRKSVCRTPLAERQHLIVIVSAVALALAAAAFCFLRGHAHLQIEF
jgi:hypothetical protein